jgi:hypothetical protein
MLNSVSLVRFVFPKYDSNLFGHRDGKQGNEP